MNLRKFKYIKENDMTNRSKHKIALKNEKIINSLDSHSIKN